MSTDPATGFASHCSCGSPLRWETREGFRGGASVALCSSPDCGIITSVSPDGGQPDQVLAAHLLGPVPIQRYLAPWTRFFWKAIRWGFRWCPAYENCTACGSELTSQLALPPLVERPTDPYLCFLCLGCGAAVVAWWMGGEHITLAISGEEWHEPTTALMVLKRTLEERADGPSRGYQWSFR